MAGKTRSLLIRFQILLLAYVLASCTPDSSQSTLAGASLGDIAQGAKIFHVQCARCHGFDGAGSSAPSLQRAVLKHAPDDPTLQHIIAHGIPGTEMPGSWVLTPPDVYRVSAYVRSLGQIEDDEQQVGDIAQGRSVYLEKGGCRTCHMINGDGGSLGPDLTHVGHKQSADFIRRSLMEPGFFKHTDDLTNTADGFIFNLLFDLESDDGMQLRGMRVNEDAFTIQMRDAANRFYSFRKDELVKLDPIYQSSLMPSVKDLLSESETEDLIAYLVSLK